MVYFAEGRHNMKRFTVIFAIVFILIAAVIVYRVSHWGKFIDILNPDESLGSDVSESADFTPGFYDFVTPLLDSEGHIVKKDIRKIVLIGNCSLLTDPIKKATGAEVVDLTVSGSYVTYESLDTVSERDNDTPYNIAYRLCSDEGSKDISDADVLIMYYEGTDYRLDRSMDAGGGLASYYDQLLGSLHLLSTTYPDLRIILVGAPYITYTDGSDGETYKNKKGYIINDYALAEYDIAVTKLNISYLDMCFDSINKEHSSEYQNPDCTLNDNGVNFIVSRIVSAIHYFDNVNEAEQK